MVGVGYFKYLGIDKRQVRADGNPIIEKARILQPAIVPVNVFFIECPADALCGPVGLACIQERVPLLCHIQSGSQLCRDSLEKLTKG